MTDEPSPAQTRRELATLIRESSALDPMLKRHWLRVLPHLKEADHVRLLAILKGEPETTAGSPDHQDDVSPINSRDPQPRSRLAEPPP